MYIPAGTQTIDKGLPLWAVIPTVIIWGLLILWIFRGIYKNFLVTLLKRRYRGPAHLDSKVEEAYKELKTYGNDNGFASIPSPNGGFRYFNQGIAYRLYFTIKGKCVELDVDKETFDSLPDKADGILDYKGNMFYSFEVMKK